MSVVGSNGMPRSALIVVNYGSSGLLARNLAGESLAEHGCQVVIVDNYTSQAERSAVKALAAAEGWTCVALDTNRGFGAGVNVGARCALEGGADVLTVLNPDAHIEVPDLMQLVSAVAEDPDLMVAPVIRTGAGAIWFDGMHLYMDSGRVASGRRRVPPAGPKEPWLTGACFAISRDLWKRVDGFDEEYFLYWEDVDLSRRVLECGGRLAVLTGVSAVHDAGGTQSPTGRGGTKSEAYYFYNIRNRLLYAAKHLDDGQVRRWLRSTLRVSYEILLADGRRQLLRSPASFRAYLQGISQGWRMLAKIRRGSKAGARRSGAADAPVEFRS